MPFETIKMINKNDKSTLKKALFTILYQFYYYKSVKVGIFIVSYPFNTYKWV